MTDILHLPETSLVARGAVRKVYAHPFRDDCLIKTFRTRKQVAFEQRKGILAHLRRSMTLGLSIGILREYRAYLRAAHRANRMGQGRAVPLAFVANVVQTDQGLGQVVERITDGQGGLALRLSDLLAGTTGMTGHHMTALNDFVASIYALGVNAPDISGNNIVWDGEAERFVLVDGFGEKTYFPMREWFPILNRRQVDARFTKIGGNEKLSWDPAKRRFSYLGHRPAGSGPDTD